jgi:hypothetical protein
VKLADKRKYNRVSAEGLKKLLKKVSQLDILYKTATNVALSTQQRK